MFVVVLDVVIFIFDFHLVVVIESEIEDVSRRGADVSKVVDCDTVIASNDGVVHEFYVALLLMWLDIVVEFRILLIEFTHFLYLIKVF